MTTSLDFDFVGLCTAIIEDVAVYYPDDQKMWDRDLTWLHHLAETRGMSVFTMDLPALRKHFDRCLADGCYTRAKLPLCSPKRGSRLPYLYWGLWSKVFDSLTGCLKDDIDPNSVLFLRTLLDVGKNWESECAPKYLYQATKEFYDVEGHIEVPSSFWDDAPLPDNSLYLNRFRGFDGWIRPLLGAMPSRDVPTILRHCQRSADRLAVLLGAYNPDQWSFRHGPGVVSDIRRGEYKYSFRKWGERLEGVFPFDRYGITGYGLMDRLQPEGLRVTFTEGHSKLLAVPKTQKGPRLIASEPSWNQWCQQNIRDFLYARVASTCLGKSIHFDDQSYNQRAALRGSIDGSVSTIDLKSASDRISCDLVEATFRRNPFLLAAMSACRTRYIVQELDKEQPKLHKLKKFSTMGSALTFPVQSLVFLAIACGVGSYLEPSLDFESVQEKVLVFGDDIIVPNHWTGALVHTLEHLGLRVNHAKTFSVGNFRESCGMDAWMGHDVTPPHVTCYPQGSNARAVLSNVAVSNNFHKKGFWRAADYMRRTIGKSNIPVVHHGSGAFGFSSFVGGNPFSHTERWNPDLQRFEYLCYGIRAKARILKQDSAAAMLQYFTEQPEAYIQYASGVVVAGSPVSRRTWVPLTDFGYIPEVST